jgi:hypothetical protein
MMLCARPLARVPGRLRAAKRRDAHHEPRSCIMASKRTAHSVLHPLLLGRQQGGSVGGWHGTVLTPSRQKKLQVADLWRFSKATLYVPLSLSLRVLLGHDTRGSPERLIPLTGCEHNRLDEDG